MIKRILSLAFVLCITGTTYANEVEFRLEGAFLKPKSNVGAFDNSSGSAPNRSEKIEQKMDSMSALKFSLAKPLNDRLSLVGSIYSPMKGVMTPKVILSNGGTGTSAPFQEDWYGVSGKFTMMLAQFGAEYAFDINDQFHPFLGGGLSFAYFYDGGTESVLNRSGHAIEDFNIDNKITWYISAGLHYDLSSNLSITSSLSYMHLKTDAVYEFSTWRGTGGTVSQSDGVDRIKLEMNPIIFTLGASWKF